ncbi:biotin/lipoyl-containing protein [Peredibacter sp. HCB2-198]|uniref:acetyl-CoA carboxylase biotin carboxyl carrier protein subunit n=1 Tax=Peredibacter sp. HCB2-198 TaxID=3383025 RepID=UPI0038B641A6
MEKVFNINGQEVKVQDFKQSGDGVSFVLNGRTYYYMLITKDGPELVLDNGGRFKAAVGTPNREGEQMIIANGREAKAFAAGKKMKKSGGAAGGLTSPMPGKIFKVIKEAGSVVKKGEPILILEAMKMEHSIRSDKDGTVKKINYKVGELVQGGVTLAEVE